jgi:nucleoside phosphorylase
MESVLRVANGEIARPEVAVFAALRREIEPLAGMVSVESQETRDSCRILTGRYGGLRLVLVQTGPGGERAAAAASLVYDELQPRIALSLGFAGALREDLGVGDLVVCESVRHMGEDGLVSEPLYCDRELLRVAIEASKASRLDVRTGRSLTVNRQCGEPGAKQRLGKRVPVDVVEMENYWLAQEASRRGRPFLAVRAVSDTMHQSLPEVQDLVDRRGETNSGRALLRLVRRPRSMVPVLRLARSAGQAASNLSSFLVAFLSQWQETEWRRETGVASRNCEKAVRASG